MLMSNVVLILNLFKYSTWTSPSESIRNQHKRDNVECCKPHTNITQQHLNTTNFYLQSLTLAILYEVTLNLKLVHTIEKYCLVQKNVNSIEIIVCPLR